MGGRELGTEGGRDEGELGLEGRVGGVEGGRVGGRELGTEGGR